MFCLQPYMFHDHVPCKSGVDRDLNLFVFSNFSLAFGDGAEYKGPRGEVAERSKARV